MPNLWNLALNMPGWQSCRLYLNTVSWPTEELASARFRARLMSYVKTVVRSHGRRVGGGRRSIFMCRERERESVLEKKKEKKDLISASHCACVWLHIFCMVVCSLPRKASSQPSLLARFRHFVDATVKWNARIWPHIHCCWCRFVIGRTRGASPPQKNNQYN